MNKDEAMKRLEAIEKETAELKKIIEASDRIVYDKGKIYVSVSANGAPALLVGRDNAYAFHTFNGGTEWSHSPNCDTAQIAIDEESDGDTNMIHVFSNRKEALEFFLSKCEE